MAANITQEPNILNSAYAPNVYVVEGLTTEDRYVLEVIIDGITVATFKQPANPAGVGIFDVSKVLQSYLKPTSYETTQFAHDTLDAHITYNVEAYLETGQTEVEPRDTGATKYVINAYTDWRNVNAPLDAFKMAPADIVCPNLNVNARYTVPFNFLTNYPEDYVVKPNEYKTLSFLTRNFTAGPAWGPNEAPFFAVFTYFLAGVQVAQAAFTLANFRGSSLRTDCTDMTVTITDDNAITTIGVGPQNQADAGISGNWDSYRVDVMSYNYCDDVLITDCASIAEMLAKADDVIYTANFTIDDTCEKFEPITVSFMNQYGVLDYYTFSKRNTRTVNTSRNNYTKALGSWSATSFSISDTERGQTVFSSASETEMTLSTNWMSDAVSEWMRELYGSPYVNIYVNGKWEPAVIATQTYEEKTYARQQLFQHEITVRFANNQKIQRG